MSTADGGTWDRFRENQRAVEDENKPSRDDSVRRVRERLHAERVTKMAQELAVSAMHGWASSEAHYRMPADAYVRTPAVLADFAVRLARRILDHEENPHLFG